MNVVSAGDNIAKARRRAPKGKRARGKQAAPVTHAEVARLVKASIRSKFEVKYSGYSPGPLSVVQAGTCQNCFGISSGTSDFNNRVGDRINLVRFACKYSWICNANLLVTDAATIRVVFFRWLENDNAIVPAVGDVLATTLYGTVNAPLAFYNNDTKRSYSVIHDELITVNETFGLSGHKVFDVKLKGTCDFIAAATAGFGRIYHIFISDQLLAFAPSLTTTAQLWYTDA